VLGAAAIAGVLAAAGPGRAQQVTLRTSDGSVTVTGPLARFQDGTFAIRGVHGELSLPAANFTCVSPACPGSTGFGIHGSNTIGAELMPRLIEAYARWHGVRISVANGAPDETRFKLIGTDGRTAADIDLKAHGSGTATPGLVSGEALIGMASRPLNAAELAQLEDHGVPDMRRPGSEHVVALDGIIVIVSPANPVSQLSLQQVQGIFAGAISDWSQVGGAPGRINVYARDSRSGTFDTFKTLVLDPGKRDIAPDARRFESSPELSDLVAKDPRGIGFIGFAYGRSAKALALTNDCGMVFFPDVFGVKTEEYPLSRRLFLYTPSLGSFAPQSVAAGFIEYALSLKAQPVIRDAGFIDQALDQSNVQSTRVASSRPPAAPDPAPAALMRDIAGTSRVSTTLRFRANSTILDNKALNDVDVLAQFLRFLRESKSRRRLVLAGFSDTEGSAAKNVALSLERAGVVRQALVRKDPHNADVIDIRGYGPTLPVACNDTEAGRDKNRRVEVWLTSGAAAPARQ